MFCLRRENCRSTYLLRIGTTALSYDNDVDDTFARRDSNVSDDDMQKKELSRVLNGRRFSFADQVEFPKRSGLVQRLAKSGTMSGHERHQGCENNAQDAQPTLSRETVVRGPRCPRYAVHYFQWPTTYACWLSVLNVNNYETVRVGRPLEISCSSSDMILVRAMKVLLLPGTPDPQSEAVEVH